MILRVLCSKKVSLKLLFLLHLFVLVYFDRWPFPTFGIRPRMSKQMSSPYKTIGGDVSTIRGGREGSVTL